MHARAKIPSPSSAGGVDTRSMGQGSRSRCRDPTGNLIPTHFFNPPICETPLSIMVSRDEGKMSPQVLFQRLAVLLTGLLVNAHSARLPGLPVGLTQQVDVDVVGQRAE